MILYDRSIKRKIGTKGPIEVMDASQPEDGYMDKLIKLIPAEIIAFYLTLNALTVSSPAMLKWAMVIITVVGGMIYLVVYNNVRWFQLILTTIPILLWIYIIGGPFEDLCCYKQYYGEIGATIYTFFVPLIYKLIDKIKENRISS